MLVVGPALAWVALVALDRLFLTDGTVLRTVVRSLHTLILAPFAVAAVVQSFVDAERGFLASFDEAAGPTLAAFVDECRKRVAGERAD